jgi:hypothetical protein
MFLENLLKESNLIEYMTMIQVYSCYLDEHQTSLSRNLEIYNSHQNMLVDLLLNLYLK